MVAPPFSDGGVCWRLFVTFCYTSRKCLFSSVTSLVFLVLG